MTAARCCGHAQGAEVAHLDSPAMFGFGAPVGFWVGQETSHLVCLGVATSPLGSAEVCLQLRLFGQQLTSCSTILVAIDMYRGLHWHTLLVRCNDKLEGCIHHLCILVHSKNFRFVALPTQHLTHCVRAVHLAGPCPHSHPELLHGRIISLYVMTLEDGCQCQGTCACVQVRVCT